MVNCLLLWKLPSYHRYSRNLLWIMNSLRNYRPISNLKVISRIIEKVAAVRLQGYLESNELNEPIQSAYMRFHSCETALTRVHNDILLEIANRHCVMLLLLDLSAAFDTVDHDILLKRLDSRLSICGTALDWFRSYFTNCTQFSLRQTKKIKTSRTQMWRASRFSPWTHTVPTKYRIACLILIDGCLLIN